MPSCRTVLQDASGEGEQQFNPKHEQPNEWRGLPRPELAAQRRSATECHDGKYEVSSNHSEGEVMSIPYVGIDLAKNVFAVHGVNEMEPLSCASPRWPEPSCTR